MVGVGLRLVDLVDGEDHRHAGGLRVVDRLDRLRHHAVVGRHDDDRHVRDLGAAGAHGGEGFVARGVEEGDLLAVELHAVSADVLRDAAGFAFDDVRLADVVQQRGFAVVDVAHDRNDRRPRHEVLGGVRLLVVVDGLLNVHRDELGLEPELFGHDHERLGVEPLVDRNHEAEVHAGRDDLRYGHVHHRRQFAHGNELRYLEDRTFLFFAFELFVHAFGHGFALVLAVFRALALGAFRRQTGERVLHLLRNLLVAHFGADHRFGFVVLVLAAATLARFGLIGVLSAPSACGIRPLRGFAAALSFLLLLGFVDVYLFLLQTLALVPAARDEARDVHRSQHLRTREHRGVRTEDVVLGRFCRRCGRLGLCGGGLSGPCGGLCFGGGRSLRPRRCGRRLCGRCRLCLSGGRNGGRLGPARGRRCGCRLRGRSRGSGSRYGDLGFRIEVDLAEDLGVGDFVLHADDAALDDDLLLLFAGLPSRLVERYGRLLLCDPLADGFAFAACAAVRAELFFEHGVYVRFDRRIGRTVAFDALLLQKVRDGVQSHVELLCDLNEP